MTSSRPTPLPMLWLALGLALAGASARAEDAAPAAPAAARFSSPAPAGGRAAARAAAELCRQAFLGSEPSESPARVRARRPRRVPGGWSVELDASWPGSARAERAACRVGSSAGRLDVLSLRAGPAGSPS